MEEFMRVFADYFVRITGYFRSTWIGAELGENSTRAQRSIVEGVFKIKVCF